MAVTTTVTRVYGVTTLQARALDAVTATGNGEWIDIRGARDMSVHVSGTYVGNVSIRGSCSPTIPADTAHEVSIGTPTADAESINTVSKSVNWIKIHVTSFTSGSITADVIGYYY